MRVSLGVAVVTALLAAACSGDDDESTDTSAVTTTATTEAIAPASTDAVTTAPESETTVEDGDGEATYEATIRRTTDGVPHVSGASVDDVAFGQGYASGQDHACTLADQLLKVQGRRAAAFGPGDGNANVESDFAWLALGIDEIARADWPSVAPEVSTSFEAFTAGWNLQLADAGTDGLTGWCAGEPWVQPITAADLYAYARSVTLLASGGRLTDFIASAQPPDAASTTATTMPPSGLVNPSSTGSNAWAVGADLVDRRRGWTARRQPALPVGGRAAVLGGPPRPCRARSTSTAAT